MTYQLWTFHFIQSLSQAIRIDREADEDDDDFPVVHDYFYETEEGYPGEGREFTGVRKTRIKHRYNRLENSLLEANNIHN